MKNLLKSNYFIGEATFEHAFVLFLPQHSNMRTKGHMYCLNQEYIMGKGGNSIVILIPK